MQIGLDFDGVISDCGKLKTEGARRMYGVEIPPERFKKELVIDKGILTSAQYRKLQQTIYSTREYGLLMEPVTGVSEFLPALVREGHTLRVITSRTGESLQVAREWSATQGFHLNFTGVGYGESKAGSAAGLDLYVDDDLDKLEPLIGIVRHLFLFSWGYNQHVDAGSIGRTGSWGDLYRTIQRMRD